MKLESHNFLMFVLKLLDILKDIHFYTYTNQLFYQ